jgi:hypothetical protein
MRLQKTEHQEDSYLVLFVKHNQNDRVKDKIDRAFSTYGEKIKVYRKLVLMPKAKRPLGRIRHRFQDNNNIIII